MADATLRWLRDQLARFEAERDRLDHQIMAYRRVIGDREQEEESGQSVSPAKVVVNEMWRILEAAGGPLHYKQIYQQLKDRGIQVPGQDPLKNVGAHLSADQRFVSDGKGMWTLKKWSGGETLGKPLPEAIERAFQQTHEAEREDRDRTQDVMAEEAGQLPQSVATPIHLRPNEWSPEIRRAHGL